MGSAIARHDPHKKIKDDFKKFDLNGDNQISVDELNTVMHSLDQNWTAEHGAKIFKAIDTDKSGSLSIDELIAWVFVGEDAHGFKDKDASVSWTDFEKYEKLPMSFAQALWRMAYVAGHWGIAMMNGQRGTEKYNVDTWPDQLAKHSVFSLGACQTFQRMVLASAMVALPEVFELPRDHPLSIQHDDRVNELNEMVSRVPYEMTQELWKLMTEMCQAGVRTAMIGHRCRAKSKSEGAYREQDRLSKSSRLFGQAACAMSKEPVTAAKFTDLLLDWQLGDSIKRSAFGRSGSKKSYSSATASNPSQVRR